MATDYQDWSDELDATIATRVVTALKETDEDTRLDWYEQGKTPAEAASAALAGPS
jgi:hypothetical protein